MVRSAEGVTSAMPIEKPIVEIKREASFASFDMRSAETSDLKWKGRKQKETEIGLKRGLEGLGQGKGS